MSLELAAIKEVVGLVAEGPAGFGMSREATGQPQIVGNNVVTEFKLNGQEAARAQHHTGINKPLSVALNRIEQKNAGAYDQFNNMLVRSSAAARYGLRSWQSSPTSTNVTFGPKPPGVLHSRQRHTLRASVDKMIEFKSAAGKQFLARERQLMGLQPTKSMVVSMSALSAAQRNKLDKEALLRGDMVSATGKPMPQHKSRSLREAYARHGAFLQAGSYMDGPSVSPAPPA